MQQETHSALMIAKALFVKYSTSQQYFFSKDPNEIIQNIRAPNVFKFKDWKCWDQGGEYLKRMYNST